MFDRILISFGPLSLLFVLIFFASSLLLPPISPTSSAEVITNHYRENEDGMKGGLYLLVLSSILWPLYSFAISKSLSRIKEVNPSALMLQISSGSVAGFSLALVAAFFASTMFRLERDSNLTQLLNDLSWLGFTLITTPFAVQEFAVSYIVLSNRSEDPFIPRWVAWVNSILTMTYFPAYAAHCVRHGPIAWDGSVTFWLPLVAIGIQIGLVSLYCWIDAGKPNGR